MAKVFSPNKQYSGVSASVTFVNGVGETKDKNLLEWFKQHGYKVGEENKTNQPEKSDPEVPATEPGTSESDQAPDTGEPDQPGAGE